jgi:hypothetical protein
VFALTSLLPVQITHFLATDLHIGISQAEFIAAFIGYID